MNDQTIQVTTDIVTLQYLYNIEDNGIKKTPAFCKGKSALELRMSVVHDHMGCKE
jgi:hypothetical protein